MVKSYAVCVQGLQSDSNTEVIILKGSIVNTIGGGVYVEGGNVTLGALNNDDALLSIEASGIIQASDPLNTESNLKPDWRYRNSSLGGNAVEARGGTLKILSGTYVAEQGHGIYVRAGNVTISGGLFQGYDSYVIKYEGGPIDGGPIAGYGASYAFFAMGGTININGGTFGVNKLRNTRLGGSGAFLTGESTTSRANVNITKAQFTAPGHAGITIYNYANVNFGEANAINNNDNIYVEGANVGLVVERGTNSDSKSDAGLGEINIYSGKYVASTYGKWADGIWYGNREIKLNIFGGEFIGNGRAGMRIETAGAVDGAISITGGDFKCLPDDTVATADEFVGAFSWLKSGSWTQELFVSYMIDINNYQVRNVPSNEIITISTFSTVNNIFTNLRHVRIEPKS